MVLVGGSSRIPLVSQMLSAAFGRPLALDNHPKHDVAIGAAISDTRAAQAPARQPTSGSPPTQTLPLAAGPPSSTAPVAPPAGAPAQRRRRPGSRPTTTPTTRRPPPPEAQAPAGPRRTGARPRPSARFTPTRKAVDRPPLRRAASTTRTDTAGAHRHPSDDRRSGLADPRPTAPPRSEWSRSRSPPRAGHCDRRPPPIHPLQRQPGPAAALHDPPWRTPPLPPSLPVTRPACTAAPAATPAMPRPSAPTSKRTRTRPPTWATASGLPLGTDRALPQLADPPDTPHRHRRHQQRLQERSPHTLSIGSPGRHGGARRPGPGLPRVRCYCGNPLAEPAQQTSSRYTDPAWDGFSNNPVTVITKAPAEVGEFTVVKPDTSEVVNRPRATKGEKDRACRPEDRR